MVDIGGGHYLKKSFVSYLVSSFTKSPAKFFRKIMFRGGLFTVEEIAKSSFSGFNSAKSGRMALDPEKLKAVIGNTFLFAVIFTIILYVFSVNV